MIRCTDQRLNEPIDTHLDDLQSEMEAGSRKLDKIRTAVLAEQFKHAEVMAALVSRLEELRASVSQQREALRILRTEIRTFRQR